MQNSQVLQRLLNYTSRRFFRLSALRSDALGLTLVLCLFVAFVVKNCAPQCYQL